MSGNGKAAVQVFNSPVEQQQKLLQGTDQDAQQKTNSEIESRICELG